MNVNVHFRPEAEREVEQGYSWYEARKPGLGDEFVDELDVSVESICAYPNAVPVVHKTVRRCLLRRFPFSVLFILDSDRVVVLAVYHADRDPEGWKSRA